MWNVMSGNKLLDRKRKEEAHHKHIRALYSVKSQINNSTPPQYSFLYTRSKANQLKHQQQATIENHNNLLVQKMIKCSSYIRPRYESALKDSLNAIYRNRVQREIDAGNQKLVKKLQSAKSTYSQMNKSMRDYDKYKSQLSNSRADPYYDMESSSKCLRTDHFAKRRPISAKH